MLLVVLYHLLLATHREIALGESGLQEIWDASRGALTRLRMPILLAVSGLLAASAIQRGYRGVRLRFLSNYWIYVVWLTLYFGFYLAFEWFSPGATISAGITSLSDYLGNLIMPSTVLWFVVAVAVFPVVLWACEKLKVPFWLVLAAAFGAWAFGTAFDIPMWIGKFLRTFVFFAMGYYGRLVVPKTRGANWGSAIVACVAFLLAAEALPRLLPGGVGTFVAATLAIVVAAVACPVIFRRGLHTRVVSFIGQRTLEIYVLHVPVLRTIAFVGRDNPALTKFTQSPLGDAVFTVGVVGLTVVVAIAIGAVLKKIPGIMALPKPWESALQRVGEDARSGALTR